MECFSCIDICNDREGEMIVSIMICFDWKKHRLIDWEFQDGIHSQGRIFLDAQGLSSN